MTRALQELHPLFHGIVWATLLGLFIVCHGCHGDEDNELCLTPGVRAQRPAQIETTAKNTIQER